MFELIFLFLIITERRSVGPNLAPGLVLDLVPQVWAKEIGSQLAEHIVKRDEKRKQVVEQLLFLVIRHH